MLFINARFLTQNFSGVQRFGYELAKRIIYLSNEIKIVAPQKRFWKITWQDKKILTCGRKKGIFWEQLELPFYLRKQKDPILFNPGNTAPLFYKKNIIVNHGLAWKKYPQAFSLKFRLWYDFLIPKILKKALFVFTVSEFCKNELIEAYKIPEEKIRVLYPGVSEIFKPLNLERENFILYVGNIQPYKNLKNLLKAYQILRKNKKELELFIVGVRDERVFKNEEFKEFNFEGVKFLGYKKDKELLELYNKARCLILPSFYETFGFPVLEAMACGCPVVASKIPALLEVAKDSALFVNPYDSEELAYAIKEILENENLRKILIQKGIEGVKNFNWDNTLKNLVQTLKENNFI